VKRFAGFLIIQVLTVFHSFGGVPGQLVRAGMQWGVILTADGDQRMVGFADGSRETCPVSALKLTPFSDKTPAFVISQQALLQFAECGSGDALDHTLAFDRTFRGELLRKISAAEKTLSGKLGRIAFSRGSVEYEREQYELVEKHLQQLPFEEVLRTEDLFFAAAVWFHTENFINTLFISAPDVRKELLSLWNRNGEFLFRMFAARCASWGFEKDFMERFPAGRGVWNSKPVTDRAGLHKVFKETYRDFMELDRYSSSIEFEQWGKRALNVLFLCGVRKENQFLTAEYLKALQHTGQI
jgi:hypothetical protein